ncbi:ABC transporter permease [Puniceibacterium sp. IMCC21224]|uniref:ABC transporter permease n=1 Tax=Puniceibacterium sp. IMCC21224 TaxID=1618204 RepID=UPI00064DFCE1|nr:ABC transporter permease [Puniceibacterium sp. IMCC21224]KMK64889.1 ABC-type nitrate/sulfonate/bicarbonate transport system, permease component [Puniceibacterium sp. IMCC21224]
MESLSKRRIWSLRAAFLVIVLVSWELASGRLASEFFISRPSAIAGQFFDWLISGTIFYHGAITLVEALSGFLLGGLIGMAVGVWLGRARLVAEVLDPFIMMFYSLPKVALAPLFVLWFGIGIDMKIYLTATIVFFLVFLNTYTGVRAVSREQIAILRLMGATERHVLFKVVLPSAITWVFTGLRLSVPYALIGAIVGELIASNRGLGYLLANSAGQFDTTGVFAALIGIMIMAFFLNAAVKIVENKAMPWRDTESSREMSI